LITFYDQLHGYQAIRSTYPTHCRQHHVNLCLAEINDPQYCLQSKLGSIQKRKQDIINESNHNKYKNKSQIPYEYKVGDQVLLETPGILRKLSTLCAGPFPVTNVYKNGTIRIQKKQKRIVSERANIRRITPFQSKAQLNIILGANDIP
jgi:hypothetical protein